MKYFILRKLFLFYLILLVSCAEKIKPQNKIAVIGKIIDIPIGGKNGVKPIVYYYKNVKYQNHTSFDARYFTYGDKFILFIDKEKPRKMEIPYPTIRFENIEDFGKAGNVAYYFKENDLKLLDSIQ